MTIHLRTCIYHLPSYLLVGSPNAGDVLAQAFSILILTVGLSTYQELEIS